MLPVSRSVGRRESFLRKQLALFGERKVQPHRATDAVRFVMASLGRLFEWRGALRVVKPDTFIRWHRKGFRLFWRWKSRPGDGPNCRATFRNTSAEWLLRTPSGARPESPTNSGSSWEFAFRLAPSASIFPTTEGERLLRADCAHCPARVPGLSDSLSE